MPSCEKGYRGKESSKISKQETETPAVGNGHIVSRPRQKVAALPGRGSAETAEEVWERLEGGAGDMGGSMGNFY